MIPKPDTAQSTDGVMMARLRRIVTIETGEIPGLLWSAAYFFCVLAAYYIVRPIREEMGVRVGSDGLNVLFTVVFVVMIAAVPAFGWVATRFQRSAVVPVVYAFFIANLILFWALFSLGIGGTWIAGAFFVWVSVFNLFVVSLFWSLMSDSWSADQAKRLYGFISAGGSAGAFFGPLITQSLVKLTGPTNLMLVSVTLLLAALACVSALRRRQAIAPLLASRVEEPPRLADMISGAERVWQSQYLFAIAITVLLANLISTYFYFEQNRIIGASISDSAERVQLFARIDLSVSILTIVAQVGLTAALMRRLGLGVSAAALPAVVIVGLLAIAASPTLWVIVGVVVVERAVAFAFASPAFRVLYTAVAPEDKYKAQNFTDTVVYRGGDAASGWLFNNFARQLGLSQAVVALLTLPLAALWLWLALKLGREHGERMRKEARAV